MTQREQETALNQSLADFRTSFDTFKTRLANVLDGLSTTLVSIQNKLDTALADQIDLTDEKATVQQFQNEVESLTSSLPTPATPNLPSEPPPAENTGTITPAAAPEDTPRSSQARSTATSKK